MACVPAPACKAALAEATRMFPTRNRLPPNGSDGICASPQHTQQNPNSDHETGEAFDLTHDPANGCDVDALFALVVARRDPRVKYLIRNKRICRSYDKPGIPAWTWAPYTGSNPHTKHGHCSIVPEARNDTSPWFAADEEDDMFTDADRELLQATRNEVGNLQRVSGEFIQVILQQIKDAVDSDDHGGPGHISAADIDAIAQRVADEQAARLKA